MVASFQCCGSSPSLQVRITISSSLLRRVGSLLRAILNSSTETSSGPRALFPCVYEWISSVSSCIIIG